MSKKLKLIIIVIILILVALFLFYKFGGRSVDIGEKNIKEEKKGISPITGQECENYNSRAFAVMLASDPITRPLSGISQADLVVEMPVVTGSITRLMAVFNCEEPKEIGSLRSSRHDFIPLALGLDAVYAHWGGSHFALDELDSGFFDNIDALNNPYNAYFRKSTLFAPHNGFTSYDRLYNSSKKLGYRLDNEFEGYDHLEKIEKNDIKGGLTIGFAGKYKVYWDYSDGLYYRWRGGEKEMDKDNNEQVKVSNVVVLKAFSRQIEGQYNDVDIEGQGELILYQNGQEIKGYWKKETKDSKMYFMGNDQKEIKLVPGKIWIEIVEPNYEIKWE
ncbi:DUF3048 domain-containing protein [Patescibacteria group bacterium]|nr:DUF3048 domain-containing protein [Patescibacteria group bacterium]MBU3922899.1 DUF3048 domain-containing protein [Patescibacteria group bacterium]